VLLGRSHGNVLETNKNIIFISFKTHLTGLAMKAELGSLRRSVET
jgi:hypothetical protein